MLYAPPSYHMTQVFNADCSYHNKMRNKRTDHSRWQRVLGEGNVFAFMPHFHTQKVGHSCWLSGSACLLVEGGRGGEGMGTCALCMCVWLYRQQLTLVKSSLSLSSTGSQGLAGRVYEHCKFCHRQTLDCIFRISTGYPDDLPLCIT